jgi:hypothetical protein
MKSRTVPRARLVIGALGAALLLGGCASTAINDNFSAVQKLTDTRLGSELKWLNTEDGFEVAGVRNSETGEATQKGYELEIPLPLFDLGDAVRARSQATYMAALNRTAQLAVDASSQVRENYGAYRTAYDVARHYLEGWFRCGEPSPRRTRPALRQGAARPSVDSQSVLA